MKTLVLGVIHLRGDRMPGPVENEAKLGKGSR